MKTLGAVAVSGFALVFGSFLAFASYHLTFGFKPTCPLVGFKGLAGSLHCGDGNPSFAPFVLGGVLVAALIAVRWWARFLRSLDA